MDRYTEEELEEGLRVVSSVIGRCEKVLPKFAEGTPQHSLLKNRIKAMRISKELMEGAGAAGYTSEELAEALAPIDSIISKCEKGQMKFDRDTASYRRFGSLVKAMGTAKPLVIDEIRARQRQEFV